MAWSWTVSLVLGWYFVGTQTKRSSIREAFNDARRYLKVPVKTFRNGDEVVIFTRIGKALRDHSVKDTDMQPPLIQRNETFRKHAEEKLWNRYSVAGDEESPGPLFNYARVHTWQRLAVIILDAHNNPRNKYIQEAHEESVILQNCDLGEPIDSNWTLKLHPFNKHAVPQIGVRQPGSPVEFTTSAPGNVVSSFIMATTFHFLTTLPAMLVSYFTPTVGLGCRSGGYLIYFLASLVSAFILVLSNWLSKRWYWHYLELRLAPESTPVSQFPDLWWDAVKFLAVATRFLGKTLAYANSIWIVLHCIFQSVGWYERCWCGSNYPVLGNNGYWIFLGADDLRDIVAPYWKGLIAFSLIVMVNSVGILLAQGTKLGKLGK
jgi:hypothetical protein